METSVQGMKTPTGLRYTFLIHFLLATAFGLFFVLIPDTFASWMGAVVNDISMYRIAGAALLSFGASSLYAFRQTLWQQVKVIVEMELTWCAFACIVVLYGLAYEGLPFGYWMPVFIFVVFGAVFATYFLRIRK